MSATQYPILHAILEQLPLQLDERALESVLASCVSSMVLQSSLCVVTYSCCPYPDWIQAPMAPSDESILSTLRLQRKARLSLKASVTDSNRTHTGDGPFHSTVTPPDTEDTEATDDTLMAMSPLLSSASYRTITNIMQQLEREGQRRRQLASRLKEARTQETTAYDSSHLATIPCKVAQPPLITPSLYSSVRLLPRTTPTPMTAWMEEHQQADDHTSRSRSFASPDTTPCSTPNSLEPKDPQPCREMQSMEPSTIGERNVRNRGASSGFCQFRWKNKVMAALVVLFTILLFLMNRKSVWKDQPSVLSQPELVGSMTVRSQTVPYRLSQKDPVPLEQLRPGAAVVKRDSGGENHECMQQDAATIECFVEIALSMNHIAPDVNQQPTLDAIHGEDDENEFSISTSPDLSTENTQTHVIMSMRYDVSNSEAPLLSREVEEEVSAPNAYSSASQRKGPEGTPTIDHRQVVFILLEILRRSNTPSGSMLDSSAGRPTFSVVDATKMAGGEGISQNYLFVIAASNSTLSQSSMWVLFWSTVAKGSSRFSKVAFLEGCVQGAGRIAGHVRRVSADFGDVVLRSAVSATRLAVKGLQPSQRVIQSKVPLLQQLSGDFVSGICVQAYRRLRIFSETGKRILVKIHRAATLKSGEMIDTTVTQSRKFARKASQGILVGRKATGRILASQAKKSLDAVNKGFLAASRVVADNGRSLWEVIQRRNRLDARLVMNGAVKRLSHAVLVNSRSALEGIGHGARQGAMVTQKLAKAASRIIEDSGTTAISLSRKGFNVVTNAARFSSNTTLYGIDSGIRLARRGGRNTGKALSLALRKGGLVVTRGRNQSMQLMRRAQLEIKGHAMRASHHHSQSVDILTRGSVMVARDVQLIIRRHQEVGIIFATKFLQKLRNICRATVATLMLCGSRYTDGLKTASRIIVDSGTMAVDHVKREGASFVAETVSSSRNVTLNVATLGIRLANTGRIYADKVIMVVDRDGRMFVSHGLTTVKKYAGRAQRQFTDLSIRTHSSLLLGAGALASTCGKGSSAVARTIEGQQEQALFISVRLAEMVRNVGHAITTASISHGTRSVDRLKVANSRGLAAFLHLGCRIIVALRSHARLSKQASEDGAFILSQSLRAVADGATEGALHVYDLLESFATLPGINLILGGVLHISDLVEAIFVGIIVAWNMLMVSGRSSLAGIKNALVNSHKNGVGILRFGVASIVDVVVAVDSQTGSALRQVQSSIYQKSLQLGEYAKIDSNAAKALRDGSKPRIACLSDSGQVIVDGLITAKDKFFQIFQNKGERIKTAFSHLGSHTSNSKLLSTAANR